MSKNVVIIGGGVIGLCSAYYLQKEGHQVTVVDQSNMDAGASYVNAGYLAPSHIIPLASPGMVKKGIKWMFNSSSPFFIKPRLNFDFLKWALAFNKSCNAQHVEKSMEVIKDISILSQELYDDIKKEEGFQFHYEKKGLLMLCQTEKALTSEEKVVKLAEEVGLEVAILNKKEVASLEPNTQVNCIGGVYFKCDYHTTPHEFMHEMLMYLENAGVTILKNEEVKELIFRDNEIKEIKTTKRKIRADEFIIASGAWSAYLSKQMSVNMLMEAGKGYRIDSPTIDTISLPAILVEAKVAVTPMNGFTRFAGTMELSGINHNINERRVNAIAKASENYYPEIRISNKNIVNASCGLRPVTPDGLPYIGRSTKCKNVVFAAGHAMMGWSMATATGKLISEVIANKKTSLNLEPFNPDRKF